MAVIENVMKTALTLSLATLLTAGLMKWSVALGSQQRYVNQRLVTGASQGAETSVAFQPGGTPFKYLWMVMQEPDTQLLMPVQGVQVSNVGNTWGAARSGGRHHAGQDIFARRGTAVYSATPGIIWRIADGGLGGKTVSVLGAGGRHYYYAHFDKHAEGLSEGAEITTETVLGYVGTTGNAHRTPPHLHFGIYTAAGAIDPLPLMVDRGKNKGSDSKHAASFSRVA
jgi:murein DD-endopeptidase MepM/ murein hydrolase activator NlpD